MRYALLMKLRNARRYALLLKLLLKLRLRELDRRAPLRGLRCTH
jgi:hypothetical protein